MLDYFVFYIALGLFFIDTRTHGFVVSQIISAASLAPFLS